MAYNSMLMRKCGETSGEVSIEHFMYDTTDNKAAVTAVNYVADALDKGMSVGDCVMVRVWPALPNSSLTPRQSVIETAKGNGPFVRHNDAAPTAVFYAIVNSIDEVETSATYGSASLDGLSLDFA